MNKKQLLFSILFCLYLKIFYFNLADFIIRNFYNACSKNNIIITQPQAWIFSIITIIYYFFSVAVIVGLFAYWFRYLRVWAYLLLGFFIRYIREIFIFPHLLFNPEDTILVLTDLAVTLLGSYLGYKYARKINYIDPRDKTGFTFWGFSKRFWCLIIIAFNPILLFLSRYFVVSIYGATKQKHGIAPVINVFNIEYRGGPLKALMLPLIVVMFWALAIYAFYTALRAVKNKGSRCRRIKIVGILIILPIITVAAQILVLIR